MLANLFYLFLTSLIIVTGIFKSSAFRLPTSAFPLPPQKLRGVTRPCTRIGRPWIRKKPSASVWL